MDSGGKITGNTTGTTGVGATLNIIVATGNVRLGDSGTAITADNTAGAGCVNGHGGVINLTASGAGANIYTDPGTRISVNGDTCPAGAINIAAPNQGTIDIDGSVLSRSNKSGSGSGLGGGSPPQGGSAQPGGGPILIDAACDLTVSATGVVSSRGKDPGADLVHLEGGCNVLIAGLVESTGVGHGVPGNPPNSCSDVIPFPGSVRRNPATRPGKPYNSTACVEVWAGDSLVIQQGAGLEAEANGEINADTGQSPAAQRDLVDRSVRPRRYQDPQLHHQVGRACERQRGDRQRWRGHGQVCRPRPQSPGDILLNGLALQASAKAHGQGGTVDVEATGEVTWQAVGPWPDGKIQAKGGDGAPGDHGGHIIVLAATVPTANIIFGPLSNLDVTGHKDNLPPDGTVLLQACAGVLGFVPGVTVTPAAIIPSMPIGCPPAVTFEVYVFLPSCPCQAGVCIPED